MHYPQVFGSDALAGIEKMSFLTNFFKSSSDTWVAKGVTYQASPSGEKIVKCLFCDIAAKKAPGSIVAETEEFVVFRTIQPFTANHLLVVPRKHIQSVHELKGEEGGQMVERMVEVGKCALNSLESGMGDTAHHRFHIPPVNSIDHLHLHAIGRPETLSFLGALKYRASTLYCWDAVETAAHVRAQVK